MLIMHINLEKTLRISRKGSKRFEKNENDSELKIQTDKNCKSIMKKDENICLKSSNS